MAQKRMFSLQVVDTDLFMDMPTSTQALYFHLGMHGDDEGFVSSPRKIARAAGCNDDDIRVLATKGFIIPFESGVVVITDWKINNTLKNDRFHETIYDEEKAMLHIENNGKYTLCNKVVPGCFQNNSSLETEPNLTKPSITKHSIGERDRADKPPKRKHFDPPSVNDVRTYCLENGYQIDPAYFVDYYTANNWMVGKNKMKDWKAAVRNWNRREQEKQTPTKPKLSPIPGVPTL